MRWCVYFFDWYCLKTHTFNALNCLASLIGFIWTEIKQMWDGGLQDYIHDWWNLMDFVMNSLYLATISLKIVAYIKVWGITIIIANFGKTSDSVCK